MKVTKVFMAAVFMAAVFMAALMANGAAQAASLENVRGEVWVGRDQGFRAILGPEDLSPGDKVKVGSDGLASIVYPDGCKVELRANALATVAEDSPCSERSSSICEGIECLGPAFVGGGLGAAGAAALFALRRGSSNPPFPLLLLAQKPASP